MTHPRKIIRDSVAAAITAAAVVDDRVWASREPPVNVEAVLIEQGPVVLVYTRNDKSAAKDSYSPQGYGWTKREVQLYVEIVAAGPAVVDDKLDTLAEVIEGILDTIAVPGMPSCEIRHIETTIETTQEFEQPMGGALLEYEACYYRQWRVEEDGDYPPFPPMGDVGVKVDGGPRETLSAAFGEPE